MVASVGGGLEEVADDLGLLPLIKTVIPTSCIKGERSLLHLGSLGYLM